MEKSSGRLRPPKSCDETAPMLGFRETKRATDEIAVRPRVTGCDHGGPRFCIPDHDDVDGWGGEKSDRANR